jgi:tRNA A37 threonylcarbamoyladenosine modification protein TsaB
LILVAIPAGRRGLYAALLDRAGRFKDEPRCAPAEAIAQGLAAIKPDQLHLTGPGSQTLIPALEQAGLDARHAAQNAPDMASLARFAVKADASEHPPQPLYVRAPDAEPAAPAPFAL